MINEDVLKEVQVDRRYNSYVPDYDEIIFTLLDRGLSGYTIWRYIERVYGEGSFSKKSVYNRIKVWNSNRIALGEVINGKIRGSKSTK